MPLPVEIQEAVVVYLPPLKCFKLSVELRLEKPRNLCLPHLQGAEPDKAAARGQVDLLQVWKSCYPNQMRWSEVALDKASRNGHVAVLEWFFKSNLKPLYTTRAIDWASGCGHVDVLECWLKSGLKLRYTKSAIQWARANNRTEVLKWWDKVCTPTSGLKKKDNGKHPARRLRKNRDEKESSAGGRTKIGDSDTGVGR
ncbi:hypothetical protein HDU86_003416 [Geranomyces michiganensis]|nr:hypothetical protein HDU86_003416 [Geranomyces michiganensis]